MFLIDSAIRVQSVLVALCLSGMRTHGIVVSCAMTLLRSIVVCTVMEFHVLVVTVVWVSPYMEWRIPECYHAL